MKHNLSQVRVYHASALGITILTWAAGIAAKQGWQCVEATTEDSGSPVFIAPTWVARRCKP